MKRAAALFSLIALIMLSASPVLAQVQVDKPVLPDGYTSWSYTKTYTCGDLKNTFWAKVDKEKDNLEVLSVIETKGNVVSYEHASGNFNEATLSNVFLMQDGKWLKFNGLDMVKYGNFLDRRDDLFATSGIAYNCIYKRDSWEDDVMSELLTTLRSKN